MRRVRHCPTRVSVISVISLMAALALGPVACIGDDSVPGTADTNNTNGATDPGSDHAGDTDGTYTPDDPDDDGVWIPALGIDIVEVEANQGTRVVIGGPDGEWIDGASRNTYLLSDRDTLIRVHYTVADGWEPHDVKALLTVQSPGGQPVTHEQELEVTGDSSPTALNRTFYFGLVAELGEAVPGTTYQVDLFARPRDQDPAWPGGSDPAAGPQQIGFEGDPMRIKVMLVPIRYTGDGNDLLPELTDEHVRQLIDGLYEHNPSRSSTRSARSRSSTTSPDQLGSLLPLMAAAKQKDGADANVYYHALIDIGCSVVGCASSGGGHRRARRPTSTPRSTGWPRHSGSATPTSTAETFVHEVGHNQGFSHVACPGADAAGPDPSSPTSTAPSATGASASAATRCTTPPPP